MMGWLHLLIIIKKKAIKNKYFRHEIYNITDFMKKNLILNNVNVFHLKNKIFNEILLFFIFILFWIIIMNLFIYLYLWIYPELIKFHIFLNLNFFFKRFCRLINFSLSISTIFIYICYENNKNWIIFFSYFFIIIIFQDIYKKLLHRISLHLWIDKIINKLSNKYRFGPRFESWKAHQIVPIEYQSINIKRNRVKSTKDAIFTNSISVVIKS